LSSVHLLGTVRGEMRVGPFVLLVCWTCCALAGERVLDFDKFDAGKPPAGFASTLTGQGKLGDWRVILDPSSGRTNASANTAADVKVLAQLSQDGTDERFPLLIWEGEAFRDFTLTTRFKLVDGLFEQMAGIAFRIQDTNNYYYVRASGIGNTFRFVKLVNGQRLITTGPAVEFKHGVWYELKIECKGNRIVCLLNGQEVMPAITDNTFTSGRIGFWTKSDSVSYFGETRLEYTLHETLAEVLVRDVLRKYPRLVGLRVYARRGEGNTPKVVASSHADELGLLGGKVESDVIERDATYFGKHKNHAIVTLPLHDRNGEVAAAVRVVMQSFAGQTEQNAVARAQPVVKEMENRIRNAKDLLQ
jgi:hypothetical protein